VTGNLKPRAGRKPIRATRPSSLTIKLPARIKNLLIDQSDAYDMSVTEYITMLAERDAVQS
jgi:hypothetical protein